MTKKRSTEQQDKFYFQCSCTGLEIKDGGTQREFKLSCKKTKKVGKKTETTWHTSCIYGGDPHSCAKYNKNQTKFYQGLVDVMAKDYCDEVLKDKECKKSQTYHTDTICTEIPYTFNRAGA